jgi:hypothetical protein
MRSEDLTPIREIIHSMIDNASGVPFTENSLVILYIQKLIRNLENAVEDLETV